MNSISTRINFTNRLRIEKSGVRISARHPNDGTPPTIRLEQLKLPENGVSVHGGAPWLTADVWLEAWRIRTNSHFRVRVGKVTEIVENANPVFTGPLDSFADLWGASYRIKVVSSDKRILAQADNLRSEEDTPVARAELIEVYPEELGEEVWRIDWADLDTGPRVLVNKRLPNPGDFLVSNPIVRATVLPNIIREVLRTIATLQIQGSIMNYEWHGRWVEFVGNFHPILFDYEEDQLADLLTWVDDAIANFCATTKFVTSLETELNLQQDE